MSETELIPANLFFTKTWLGSLLRRQVFLDQAVDGLGVGVVTAKHDVGFLAEDIENMVNEAEKYKEQDEEQKEIIEAKNTLESIIYQAKNVVSKDEIKDKLDENDIEIVNNAVADGESWLYSDVGSRTKDDYNNKLKELNDKINPIMMKLQGPGQESGMPGQMPGQMPGEGGMPDFGGMDPAQMAEMMKGMGMAGSMSGDNPEQDKGPTLDEVD